MKKTLLTLLTAAMIGCSSYTTTQYHGEYRNHNVGVEETGENMRIFVSEFDDNTLNNTSARFHNDRMYKIDGNFRNDTVLAEISNEDSLRAIAEKIKKRSFARLEPNERYFPTARELYKDMDGQTHAIYDTNSDGTPDRITITNATTGSGYSWMREGSRVSEHMDPQRIEILPETQFEKKLHDYRTFERKQHTYYAKKTQ